MDGFDFRVLGPLEAYFAGRPTVVGGARQCTILAMSPMCPERVVPVDALAEAVWDGHPPATSRTRKVPPGWVAHPACPGPTPESSALKVTRRSWPGSCGRRRTWSRAADCRWIGTRLTSFGCAPAARACRRWKAWPRRDSPSSGKHPIRRVPGDTTRALAPRAPDSGPLLATVARISPTRARHGSPEIGRRDARTQDFDPGSTVCTRPRTPQRRRRGPPTPAKPSAADHLGNRRSSSSAHYWAGQRIGVVEMSNRRETEQAGLTLRRSRLAAPAISAE